MVQAVPGAISLYVIVHHWRVRPFVTQLAFRKWALHASPDMCTSFALQELSAIKCGVVGDMFLKVATIAFEDLFIVSIGEH